MPRKTTAAIYQIKITLQGIKPPIWRRVLVPADITLDRLHFIVLAAMGWGGGHMHMFEMDGQHYGEPDGEFDGMKNEARVKLNKLLCVEKDSLMYEYDFGDSWRHKIVLEKILPPVAGATVPVCLAGARACPPEDCGGEWGYANLLAALADPKHEEHEAMCDWIGYDFDPADFDLADVNQYVTKIRV